MTRSDRVLRVFVIAGLSGAAACGLGLAGLEVPQGEEIGSGNGKPGGSGSDDGGGDDATTGNGDDSGVSGGFGDDATSPSGSGGGSSGGGSSGDDGGFVAAHGDAMGPTVPCNFNGTWGTKLTIPVNWVPQGLMSIILMPGSGTISQWILQTRVQSGTTLTDTAYVCGVTLPDFAGTIAAGAEAYGVRFPDSLFDDHYLPSFTIAGMLSAATTNATYSTSATAALLGLQLGSAATAPWPSLIDAYVDSVDSDHDGNPGVTANAAVGPGYSLIPVNIEKSERATAVFVVIRQITQVSGTVTDCNHMSGSVSIPQLTDSNGDSKYAIDSHVIGCQLDGDAGPCTDFGSFIDGTQPVFSPSGNSTFQSMRLANGASCAQVRAAIP